MERNDLDHAQSGSALTPEAPITTPARRQFIARGSLGVAALAAPAIVSAKDTYKWRFQSTWPVKFLYHEFAVDWTRIVQDLSGGRIQIQMLPANSIVPGLQVIDAVHKGVLDGAHAIPGFWFGKNTAFGLYGAGPDFAMGPNQMLGWIEQGGGKELFAQIQAAAGLNLHSFLFGPVPCEPLGWFSKEIRTPEDLKGLKFRTAGLAVDMFKKLGVSAVQMAPADIVPSIDRGVLDGAEFASASDDRIMGFPDVAKFYLQKSYHQANNFCEIMLNKDTYQELPDDLKAILNYASHAASAAMAWKAMDRMSTDYLYLESEAKVNTYETPEPILKAQLEAWDAVVEQRSTENPLFAKVIESQRKWAERVMYWENAVTVSSPMAYDHYFGKGPSKS